MLDCDVTLNSDLTVTATFDVPDFSITPASTALNLQSGGQGTDVITLAGQPFAGAIQLVCEVSGPAPYRIAVNPTTNKIYVLNELSNNVTVIDGAHD